jgi:predicted P-loop ATPase
MAAGTVLTDHHETKTRTWFQREDIKAAQGDVGRAIQAAAQDAPFHPVREYFDALVWDGTPRIDTWLQIYFHADDTPYTRSRPPLSDLWSGTHRSARMQGRPRASA